jgi:hypothetical protein
MAGVRGLGKWVLLGILVLVILLMLVGFVVMALELNDVIDGNRPWDFPRDQPAD